MSTEPAGDRLLLIVPCAITAASDMNCLSTQWKIQGKGCSRAWIALNANLSRMLLDDAVGHRKPEPGTPVLALLWRCLGSKEWIVNALNVLGRDARSSVGHSYAYHFAIGSGDRQLAAAAHCIFRVQEQVE